MESSSPQTPPAGVKYRRGPGPIAVEIEAAGDGVVLSLVDRHTGMVVRAYMDPQGARMVAGGLRVLADQIESPQELSSGLERIGGTEQ